MKARLNWATIIPTAVFCLTLWQLQSALATIYSAAQLAPQVKPGRIGRAHEMLWLSTFFASFAVAWASYRFNTALYKGSDAGRRDGP